MISCRPRAAVREETLRNLARTDWDEPVTTVLDDESFERAQTRQEHTAYRLLEILASGRDGFGLFLEDDLEFNRYLRHNLTWWSPLRDADPGARFFASLYNPNIRHLSRQPGQAYFVADPEAVYGSQAFLLSVAMARYIIRHWHETIGMQDIKMSRLAGRTCPIYYHTPSLVQHVGERSTWGGSFHWAQDFSPDWRA
jgi:hypothetical protein